VSGSSNDARGTVVAESATALATRELNIACNLFVVCGLGGRASASKKLALCCTSCHARLLPRGGRCLCTLHELAARKYVLELPPEIRVHTIANTSSPVHFVPVLGVYGLYVCKY
jgi:hypothetical protein